MTGYFNCFCLCSSLFSSKCCFPLTKFKDLLVLWFWSTQAVPWCVWGLDPKTFQNGRCKWEKDSSESFSGDVLEQRGGASHTSLVCTCKGMDNPFTHSICRCLCAQGIPWERKQTLLHWVLHCYKEITAKAFSFKMPISNVMFFRKKSDFFFLLLYSIKGFWAFMFILQDFCPCHVHSDFLQKSFFYEGQHKYGKESLSFLQRRKI